VKRLTPASLTLMMFGVVALLIVAYVAKNLLAAEAPPAQPTEELLPMAIADIPAGTRLTEAHVGRGPYPRQRLEPDMLRTTRVIENRYTRRPIRAGQPIRANDLLAPGELPALRVAEGMRAISVEVGDSTAMVDGMLQAGDFVDVLFTFKGGNDETYRGGVTLRLFEGVRVLVVNRGASSSRGDRGGNHVTLELTEPQANVLTLAHDRGAITLTYNPNGRGAGGLAVDGTERVTLYDILGLKPATEPFLTEIFRGSGRSTNRFNEQGRLIEAPATSPNVPAQQLPPAGNGSPQEPSTPSGATSTDRPTAPTAARIMTRQN
jgi:pilus assembly protein CpaB